MKAIHVEVGFDEWKKVEPFINEITDENILTYTVDNIQFVVVAEGECSMTWAKGQIEAAFEEPTITELR